METPTNFGSEIGGASNSVPQTRRVFSSRKYGFRVEKREDGFYVLSGSHGQHETRDFEVMVELVELYASPKDAQLLKKKVNGV